MNYHGDMEDTEQEVRNDVRIRNEVGIVFQELILFAVASSCALRVLRASVVNFPR
jgi:hypothetical protein